ncbi:hypothetical protein Cyan10605_3027 [Cyanobacterium aponinum PCC 10605]|uniref:Uncharacterized protein n=1 Tax=Cyanobacterium aponinum (strain PCC 10605) TaxID=755178 RepID=K9Z7B2_CYAAP|nr:hypothetical protein Cyan10605_3027 [Cyanobacterium aponinum PCC 10605]
MKQDLQQLYFNSEELKQLTGISIDLNKITPRSETSLCDF